MEDKKKYYWIKLRTGFFDEDEIDWLLSQENGCQYVVLYQMLCLKTANSNGSFSTKVGEIIVPYDVGKIVRDTKYFDYDTVVVALELYKKLGLVYEDSNGSLVISNFTQMVGSESASKDALKKREYRNRLKERSVDNKVDNIEDNKVDKKGTNCPTEIRDKRLEIRDKSIDKRDKEKKEKESSKSNRFAPPSVDDVRAYCLERGNNIDPDKFVDYYTGNGWMVGRNKMKDWKATVRSWERNDFNSGKKEQKKYGANGIELDTERDPIDEELDKLF